MNEQLIISVLSQISGLPLTVLTLDKEINDLEGWDSFMWLELALEMEKLGYDRLVQDIDEVQTINNLVQKVIHNE